MAEHLPLNALRAFEVAARTGSFTAAGEELGVSSAAVSQQVKALEQTFNRILFLRIGNRITLTDAGRALYPRLETVFSDLTSLTRELREGPHTPRLTLSVLPSLAELWLIPVLARYPARQMIDLRVEPDPIDFARGGADLRLTYGGHYYPDHHVETLFQDRFIAVAAPGFGVDELGKLDDTDLIHTDWGQDFISQPDWAKFFAAADLSRQPKPGIGLRTDRTELAALAAQEGAGVALVPERLARAGIEKGRLVQVGQTVVPLTNDYLLIRPQAFARKRALLDLCGYLVEQSRAPGRLIPRFDGADLGRH